jgi:hypothetical protein
VAARRSWPAPGITEKTGQLRDYADVIDLLVQQGSIEFRVASDSMSPALKPGDVVRLSSIPDRLDAGTLVAVRQNRGLVCHRFVREYRDAAMRGWVVTRGDRSSSEDDPVPADAVVGVVHTIIRPSPLSRLAWSLRSSAGAWVVRLGRRGWQR